MKISAHGLALDPPDGWDARIRIADDSGPTGVQAHAVPSDTRTFSAFPVLHAADFPLPEQRGDFGSSAVELMRPTNAFIALIEYHPDSVRTALFASAGLTRQVSVDAFSPQRLQRTLKGQAGWQRFFVEKGRAFCLYVVLGSYANRITIVKRVNETLTRIEVEAS
ncbi:MAG: hypothetical protein QOG44_2730 [Acidimicrobiaceae bacterium]|jgi:hypothetical protein|nr:hypothetical protein [Acidimicrobiaceae bacterium]MDQ1441142.1 hypothetical protein [Acidimicrobiaceae bacterium]